MHPFKITQIYYDQISMSKCFAHAFVYRLMNEGNPAPLFENKIFLQTEKSENALYQGVWSWKAEMKIKRAGNRDFDIEKLESVCKNYHKKGVEMIAFHKLNTRQIIFHGRERERFNEAFQMICDRHNVNHDYRRRIIVMNNHFLLDTQLWDDYRVFLKMIINYINSNEQLKAFADCRSSYKADSSVNYCYWPFLLELVPSLYATVRNLECRYY